MKDALAEATVLGLTVVGGGLALGAAGAGGGGGGGGGGAVADEAEADLFLPGGKGGGTAKLGGLAAPRMGGTARPGLARPGAGGGVGGALARLGSVAGKDLGGVGGMGFCGELFDRVLPGTGGAKNGLFGVGEPAAGAPDDWGAGAGGGGGGGAAVFDAAAAGLRPGIGGGALKDLGRVLLAGGGRGTALAALEGVSA